MSLLYLEVSKFIYNNSSNLIKLEEAFGVAHVLPTYEVYNQEVSIFFNSLLESDRLILDDLYYQPYDERKITSIINLRLADIINDFYNRKWLSSYLETILL